MIFQNPFDTLNPSYTVGSQIMRTLEQVPASARAPPSGARPCCELLDLVKLPRAFARRSPRQLSGGQKQRIGVARAFAGDRASIIADEPMSALDVSVQAAISELLMNIQRESKTTMVFISHDLSVVRYLADRVIVMYLGHIVEMGATEQIFSPPFHPYTEALLSAIPIADPTVKKRHVVLEGDIPSALSPPKGCPFQTRCGHKGRVPGSLCERVVPPVRSRGGRPHDQMPPAGRGARAHGAGVLVTKRIPGGNGGERFRGLKENYRGRDAMRARPPHRSVRAGFPHTAPASDVMTATCNADLGPVRLPQALHRL